MSEDRNALMPTSLPDVSPDLLYSPLFPNQTVPITPLGPTRVTRPVQLQQQPQQGLQIIDDTKEAGFGNRFGNFAQPPIGMIIHHTGGGSSVDDTIRTFKERGYPAQFVIDRDGKIYQTLPDGAQGRQIMNGWGPIGAGKSNANTEGVEVIADNDKDVLPVQQRAAWQLVQSRAAKWGYDPKNSVWGHGEVNPGHKEADEGMTIVNGIRSGDLPNGRTVDATYAADRPSAIGNVQDPSVSSPGLGWVPEQWRGPIINAARANGVDPNLLASVIKKESNFNPDERGASGEIGLGQLMPETARDLGVDPTDPNQNLMGAARYLRQQLDNPRSGGSVSRALMMYNGGPNANFNSPSHQRYASSVIGQPSFTDAPTQLITDPSYGLGLPPDQPRPFVGAPQGFGTGLTPTSPLYVTPPVPPLGLMGAQGPSMAPAGMLAGGAPFRAGQGLPPDYPANQGQFAVGGVVPQGVSQIRGQESLHNIAALQSTIGPSDQVAQGPTQTTPGQSPQSILPQALTSGQMMALLFSMSAQRVQARPVSYDPWSIERAAIEGTNTRFPQSAMQMSPVGGLGLSPYTTRVGRTVPGPA